jgi:hypothetical protein
LNTNIPKPAGMLNSRYPPFTGWMILVPVLGGLIFFQRFFQRNTSSRFLKYENKRTGQFWVFWKKSESNNHWFWVF